MCMISLILISDNIRFKSAFKILYSKYRNIRNFESCLISHVSVVIRQTDFVEVQNCMKSLRPYTCKCISY